MALESPPEPLEVGSTERHRPATGDALGGISEAHETLPSSHLEKLDDGGELPVAGSLLEPQFVEHDRLSPRSRRLRCHERERSTNRATQVSRIGANFVTKPPRRSSPWPR